MTEPPLFLVSHSRCVRAQSPRDAALALVDRGLARAVLELHASLGAELSDDEQKTLEAGPLECRRPRREGLRFSLLPCQSLLKHATGPCPTRGLSHFPGLRA